MILYDKSALKQVKIYDVSKDKHGYPEVLIRDGNQWRYRSMKHYITDEEYKERHFKNIVGALDEVPTSEKCLKCPMITTCYGYELINPCEKCTATCEMGEYIVVCRAGDECLFKLKE